MDWLRFEFASGAPVTHGTQRMTPRALIAHLHIPWPGGGTAFSYKRPILVEIESDDTPVRRIPIFNYTRLATIGVIIYATILANILWRITHVRK
jgi:hypothetical protein